METGHLVTGIITLTAKGMGFVRTPEWKSKEDSIEIDSNFLNTALQGDIVEVELFAKNKFGNQTGKVTNIIKRSKAGFSGIIEREGDAYFLVPRDQKMYKDIRINSADINGAVVGDMVFAVITEWTDPKKAPLGKVVQVLGKPRENNAEMMGIALEKGFFHEFPDAVEAEAQAIGDRGITEEDFVGRRDMRDATTFTIDPADAKDFDDALSVRTLPDGTYEIGIHIADVSHYVLPDTALDREAYERNTSVYLVDRTIPMLPEVLSNGLCSLNPHLVRLTMSAVFIMNDRAEVLDRWFGKTIIHSDRRFTYEDAQEVLNTTQGDFYAELNLLNTLAKKLTKERFLNGALSLDQEEVKFKLDENGVPIAVYTKIRQDTNRLIEEFMLLANREVSTYVAKLRPEQVYIYRIHDTPAVDRMGELHLFLKRLGHTLPLVDGVIPSKALNDLLVSLDGQPGKDTIQVAIVRTMAKAIYSTKAIGHYGLGFQFYSHFTSPIRRYPDVIAHRLLQEYLHQEYLPKAQWPRIEEMCRYGSDREKEAAEAERGSIKYKQVEYMSLRIGAVFSGTISGIAEWGVYIQEDESKCEGMIKLRELGNDFYTYDEKNLKITGEKTKKEFKIGDKVKIKVVGADLDKKTLDYVFA